MNYIGNFLIICLIIAFAEILLPVAILILPIVVIIFAIKRKFIFSDECVTTLEEKKETTYFILCVFFGWCGIHKFYRKETKKGILYLCTFGVFCIGWLYDIVIASKRMYIRIFENKYYRSEEFIALKNRVLNYIKNCNELNDHVSKLRKTTLIANQVDYGKANYKEV